MNTPYPPVLIEAEGKLYPYNDERLARISVIENTRFGLPPAAVWKLEPELFGYCYRTIDAVEFALPPTVKTETQELSVVA